MLCIFAWHQLRFLVHLSNIAIISINLSLRDGHGLQIKSSCCIQQSYHQNGCCHLGYAGGAELQALETGYRARTDREAMPKDPAANSVLTYVYETEFHTSTTLEERVPQPRRPEVQCRQRIRKIIALELIGNGCGTRQKYRKSST